MASLATIGKADVANFLHPSEMKLVEEDKLAQLITVVCDEVNGYAAACPSNPRVAPGTLAVPAELKHAACVLVRKAILSGTMPGTSGDLDQSTREAEYQAALSTLRAAAACELNLADYSEDEAVMDSEGLILGGGQPAMNFMPL